MEAQFGDFANSAQVIIDSFIVAGESKWDRTTSAGRSYPHGYVRGARALSARTSASSSSAPRGTSGSPTRPRPRSTSTSCAARRGSPSRGRSWSSRRRIASLRAASSSLEELTPHTWFVHDLRFGEDRDKIDRPVLCSGKLFFDIDQHERRESATSVALGRVELLYPFARNELERLINAYLNLKKIVWAQEEPKNMGAWSVMARRLPELIPEGVEAYVRRPPAALEPERGLPGRPPPGTGAHSPHGVRG